MGEAFTAALVAVVTAVLGWLDKKRVEAKAAREKEELGRLRNEVKADKVGEELATRPLADLYGILRFDPARRRVRVRQSKAGRGDKTRTVSDILAAQRRKDRKD